jgi:hypothetical protein
MVIGNNARKLWKVRYRVLADNITFGNANMVSTMPLDRVLVPFERNSECVKELWYQYVCSITKQGSYTAMNNVKHYKTVDLLYFREEWRWKPGKLHIHSSLWVKLDSTWQKHTAGEEM